MDGSTSSQQDPSESIRSHFQSVIIGFVALLKVFATDDPEDAEEHAISQGALEDELAQFRLWSGTNGAHRTGRSSLDHKLRLASRLRGTVIEYLTDLEAALQKAFELSTRPSPPPSPSVASSSSLSDDEDLPSTTPLQYAFREIQYRIKSLVRLSTVLRQPSSRDLTAKFSKEIKEAYKDWDLRHVEDKLLAMGGQRCDEDGRSEDSWICPRYLVVRLAEANTQRRQLLHYLRDHRRKIFSGIDDEIPTFRTTRSRFDSRTVASRSIARSYAAYTSTVNESDDRRTVRSSQTGTTNSTFIETAAFLKNMNLPQALDGASDDGHTATSFASSAGMSDVGGDNFRRRLQIPTPPRDAEPLWEKEFTCPLCWYPINPGGNSQWRRHVMRDICPYICTFEDCPLGSRQFDSRHDWFNHEQQYHRREWCCGLCGEVGDTRSIFKEHLKYMHPEEHPIVDSAIDMCERATLSNRTCIICGAECPARKIQKHLGRHLEDIAQFIIQNWWEPCELGDDTDENSSQNDSISFDSDPDRPPGSLDDDVTYDDFSLPYLPVPLERVHNPNETIQRRQTHLASEKGENRSSPALVIAESVGSWSSGESQLSTQAVHGARSVHFSPRVQVREFDDGEPRKWYRKKSSEQSEPDSDDPNREESDRNRPCNTPAKDRRPEPVEAPGSSNRNAAPYASSDDSDDAVVNRNPPSRRSSLGSYEHAPGVNPEHNVSSASFGVMVNGVLQHGYLPPGHYIPQVPAPPVPGTLSPQNPRGEASSPSPILEVRRSRGFSRDLERPSHPCDPLDPEYGETTGPHFIGSPRLQPNRKPSPHPPLRSLSPRPSSPQPHLPSLYAYPPSLHLHRPTSPPSLPPAHTTSYAYPVHPPRSSSPASYAYLTHRPPPPFPRQSSSSPPRSFGEPPLYTPTPPMWNTTFRNTGDNYHPPPQYYTDDGGSVRREESPDSMDVEYFEDSERLRRPLSAQMGSSSDTAGIPILRRYQRSDTADATTGSL